jgi:hypothetical protein
LKFKRVISIYFLAFLLLIIFSIQVFGVTLHTLADISMPRGNRGNYNNVTSQTYSPSFLYPVYIEWEFDINRQKGGSSDDGASFKIDIHKPDGSTQSKVDIRGYGTSASWSGNFWLPAQSSITVTVNSGHYKKDGHNYEYDTHYLMSYVLDEAAPNQPGAPRVNNIGDGKVYNLGGITYTNNTTIPLQWNSIQDNGTLYNGYNIISGINDYILYIDGIEQFSPTYTANQGSLSSSVPGLHTIQLQARDVAGNLSTLGNVLNLFVDQTGPTVPGQPYIKAHQNDSYIAVTSITWTWDVSTDSGSGLKKYQIYITKGDGTVIANWVDTTTNSYTQNTEDGASYICKVRAVDNVSNQSGESTTSNPIIIDCSVPQVTFPEYPLHFNGNQLTFDWKTVIDSGSGIAHYEIVLTGTAADPDSVQADIIEKNTTLETEYRFATLVNPQKKYYAWIRAIDRLGNKGTWRSAGPFPNYTIQSPDDGAYLNSEVKFSVSSTDGSTLRFRVAYKMSDTQYSPLDSSSVTLNNLDEGKYQWWLEIYEGEDSEPQITGKFSFVVDNTAPPKEMNSFQVQSLSDNVIYDTGAHPTNTVNVKLSDITLYDAGSGIKELYFWNGQSTTTPSDAVHKAINESGPDKSPWKLSEDIDWSLPAGDGEKTITMEVVDNAGKSTLVTYQILLDTTLPPAPDEKQLNHITTTSQITFNWQADNTNGDVAGFQGTYTLPDGTSKSYQVTPINNDSAATGTLIVPVSNYGPNQPVTVNIFSIDKAGNQSAPITYTAYTKAAPGSLQNLDGGYNTATGQFFLSWQVTDTFPSGANQYILEYGTQDTSTNTFTVLTTLSPVSGIFTHSGLVAHGSYSYRFVALNSSGDRTEGQVFTRQVPNTPPTVVELKSPLSFARGKAAFTFAPSTDADGDNIIYNLYLKAADAKEYTEYLNVTSGYEVDGLIHGKTYNWYIEAYDGYNITKNETPGTFIVDTVVPTLTIEPAHYAYTNQRQLTITAGDALSGIDKISYTKISAADNTTIGSGVIDLTDNGSSTKSGMISLTEGNYHLHFTAFDKAGNSTAVEVNNLKVDQTQPVLTNTQLDLNRDGSDYFSSGKLPVSFIALDNLGTIQSGVSTMRYWILSERNAEPGAGQTVSLSPNLRQFSQNFNISGTSGNEYYLALAVEDAAGNRSEVQYFGPIKLDTSAPEASLSLMGLTRYGSNLYLADSNNLTAACTAKDDQSGIAGTLFAILNSASGEAISSWGAWENIKQIALKSGASYQVAAKVTNQAGLTTEIKSEKFIYDHSAPQDLTLNGPTSDVASGEQVSFAINATEAESSIAEYRLSIASSDGILITTATADNQDGWLVQSGNQFRFELPTAPDGNYIATVEVVNAAGLKSSTHIALTINNHQEKVLVSDQGPYTGFSDKLTGWWKYTGSKAVNNYQYRITEINGGAVTDWVNTNDTQVTATNLKLESGKAYRFEVQANLNDGNSVTGLSSGVTVDATIPVINSLVTPNYSTSENLAFTWGATDNESGIAKTWVALGSSYYQTDITGGWVEVSGTSSSLTRDVNGKLLNLTSGKSYYLTLRVSNGAGLEAEKAAPGVIINNVAPPTPVVTDQGDYINPTKQPLKANWIWTPFDVNGGKVTYQWALIPYGTNIDSASWTDAGDATAASVNQPDLPDGTNYRFAVKATNQAGLSSIGYSDGIMIDKNAPIIPEVTLNQAISLGESKAATYITSTKDLTLSINSYDLNGITVYQYTFAGQSDIKKSSDYDTSSTATIAVNPSVTSDQVTVYKAVCSDGATNLSQAGYSTGVILDTGAPKITSVNGAVSGNTLIFNWDVVASTSPVVSYEYALVPEAQMNNTPSSWTNASLNRSILIDATNLKDGKYRLLVRGLNAAGTYSRRQNGEWGISSSTILDREAPVMDAAGLNYAPYADNQMKVTATAGDNLSGIGGYQYALGTLNNPTLYSNGWVDVAGTEGFIEFNVPTSNVSHNSLVYLMVRAKDNVGLWSSALVSQKILIDHTAPTTPVITYGSGSYNTSKTQVNGITFTSSDPESAVTHYRMGIVAAPGGEWQSIQEAPIDQFDGTLPYLSLFENQVFYIAIQTYNGAGVWSETGYSQAITVDTISPELEFTNADTTLIINTPPLNIEYLLSEEANIKFTLSGADGTAQSSTVSCTTGVNNFIFNQSTPQTYTLKAEPVDPAGNAGIAKTQTIRVNAPPVITLTSLSTTPGAIVIFNAAVSDPDGHPVSYIWDPGDGGQTVSGVVATYQYTRIGTYTLKLTVTDNDGGLTVATTTVVVGNTTHGTLYVDETWSGTHYVYGGVFVPAGITLTVLPGTQVIVDAISDNGYTLDIKGTLNIAGGGQTVSFGSSSGEAGSWKGIYLEGQAALDGVIIKDAERGLTVVTGATAALNNCIFQNNQTGLHVYGTIPAVSNCLFLGNTIYGVKEDEGGRPVVTGCTFTGNGMDYYSETDTDLTMDELNQIAGNSGNK